MARSPDFFRQLTEQLLEQLEEFARQPGRTGDEVQAWLTQHKVQASRSAVYRWLQDFRLEDRARRAGDVAKAYLAAAREADPVAVTEASLRKFEEMVFDWMVSSDGVDAKDLMFIASAMKTGLGSRKEVLELKRRQQDALAAAEKQAKAGATGADVVKTIKQALGIAV